VGGGGEAVASSAAGEGVQNSLTNNIYTKVSIIIIIIIAMTMFMVLSS